MKNLAKLQKSDHILGLTNVVFKKDRLCSTCQAGKQVGAPHPTKNIMTSKRPLKLQKYTLICLDPLHTLALAVTNMILSLLMIFLVPLGYSFYKTKVKLKEYSRSS
jgi:hypothetical protein